MTSVNFVLHSVESRLILKSLVDINSNSRCERLTQFIVHFRINSDLESFQKKVYEFHLIFDYFLMTFQTFDSKSS